MQYTSRILLENVLSTFQPGYNWGRDIFKVYSHGFNAYLIYKSQSKSYTNWKQTHMQEVHITETSILSCTSLTRDTVPLSRDVSFYILSVISLISHFQGDTAGRAAERCCVPGECSKSRGNFQI